MSCSRRSDKAGPRAAAGGCEASRADSVVESGLGALVLAAGLGTRMRSERAKVLHQLGGEPMLARVMRTLVKLGPRPLVVVVGYEAEEVKAAAHAALGDESALAFAVQPVQRGTGDAARTGLAAIAADFKGDILITYGDLPLVSAATLTAFLNAHRRRRSKLSFVTATLSDGGAYGRVVRDADGEVQAIVEARDASPAERAITEINTGVYLGDAALMRSTLGEINAQNAQAEYYLTDVAALARRRGVEVLGWRAADAREFAGINSREELAEMEADIRRGVNQKLMAGGVTLIDPATAYVSEQAEIGPDTILGPNVQILGRCRIGRGVHIEGTAWLSDVTVGDRSHLKIGVRAEDCVIGEDCEIGPFANLRTGTELEGHNRVGNFVETKKARIGRGSKASHLSYLGDAIIGRDSNIGCGVITVNYDGYEKRVTRIGDRCMVGCDSQLVAPVAVGDDVYVASGTTIVREVPAGALVVSHHPQHEKPGWVAAWRKRHNDPTPVAKGAAAAARRRGER
jgi:bifunctional UDP-N-acetylglucosamine pyrophosphorylase / glucosamine-1-phosphate N-acetyltransferase